MSKHRLSPAPLPPAKRLHTLLEKPLHSRTILTFDNSLYDELLLVIFSYLSYIDLCTIQATSRNCRRLASDNELWRKLYVRVFGNRPRIRGTKGFSSIRSDGKQIKALPGRAREANVDWKASYRLATNWLKGRCSVEPFSRLASDSTQDHIVLAGPVTITASSAISSTPVIHLHLAASLHQLICNPTQSCSVTALSLDQSTPVAGNLRLAAFLSTGEFTVFSFHPCSTMSSSVISDHVPVTRSSRTSPIIQAVYRHPLLITLSESFCLSLYDVTSRKAHLMQSLTSYTSFPPTSLVMSAPSPSIYKLVLVHTCPVYPQHWSVGSTEIIIAGSESPSANSSTLLSADAQVEPLKIMSTRTARALDVPQGWIDERKLRTMREQWSRKVLRVADTQTDGKWVVLAPGQLPQTLPGDSSPFSTSHSWTSLQLYRLSFPSASSISSAPPKLTFVRNLTGPGPIVALAVADGRCVSLGCNGSIFVWDLERGDTGTGVEVAAARDESNRFVSGAIAFDERRIIFCFPGGHLTCLDFS
ncbi:hypothetical protein C8J56DRAFT_926721 [Mycena floridula]|nr:hypothetical protein C8J56DRAFT_926721 [Mycena floridula]